MAPSSEDPRPDPDHATAGDAVLALVRRALHGLRYGQVVLQVHDGAVVQIERTEKLRPVPRKIF